MSYQDFIKNLNIKSDKEIKQEEIDVEEMLNNLKNKDAKFKIKKEDVNNYN